MTKERTVCRRACWSLDDWTNSRYTTLPDLSVVRSSVVATPAFTVGVVWFTCTVDTGTRLLDDTDCWLPEVRVGIGRMGDAMLVVVVGCVGCCVGGCCLVGVDGKRDAGCSIATDDVVVATSSTAG